MQKKIIALAVAGLSTAAIAQTNVTIYGVADVSGQGTNMSSSQAAANPDTGKVASGGAFNLKNNSSLIGFKGTEDIGNGNKVLFQMETNVNLTGGSAVAAQNGTQGFGSMRDSYIGFNSKYGTALAGYLSTPYRSTLTSFDVMPGATGDGRNENIMGKIRAGGRNGNNANTVTGSLQADASIRATALAYALPTLYGFNGSIAYTGSGNNGSNNQTTTTLAAATNTTVLPQGALSMNLGWTGYGVNVQGAYQQAKVNASLSASPFTNLSVPTTFQGYTSYLVGASYTGIQGLKVAAVYGRNTLGTNQNNAGTVGAQKGSNNQIWLGASYRFGNNEPRLSYVNSSNTSGLQGFGQDGGTQWTANWGYYLSKRTQVYGLVSGISNRANAVWTMGSANSNLMPTGGQNILTYGAGLRTNF